MVYRHAMVYLPVIIRNVSINDFISDFMNNLENRFGYKTMNIDF